MRQADRRRPGYGGFVSREYQLEKDGLSKKQRPIEGMTFDRDRIWCLGTEVGGCKYVPWHASGVSFADCDVLIVDARSVSFDDMLLTDPKQLVMAKREIAKRTCQEDFTLICIVSDNAFFTEAEIVSQIKDLDKAGIDSTFLKIDDQDLRDLITEHGVSNYFWFPYDFKTYKIGAGATRLNDQWKSTTLHKFAKYFEGVESYTIGLNVSWRYMLDMTTKSGDLVACLCRQYPGAATTIMLPPLQTPEKSVSKVLEILSPVEQTPEPEWSARLNIPGSSDMIREISGLKKEIVEKMTRIKSLENDLADKRSLTRLLYATGGELEHAVMDALSMLGLDVKRGDAGREDLVLKPSVDTRYDLCSIEIKGVTKKIKRDDLRQLAEWVDRQWEKNAKSKGVLVVSMHRLSDIHISRNDRDKLDPDQLEFAQTHEFCIMPTFVLFDLCIKSMSGDAIDRQKIEEAIISAKGFVTLADLCGPAVPR